MIKGFIGALISAIVLFAAGGITVVLFGRNEPNITAYVESVDYSTQGGSVHDSVTGEKTWQFGSMELGAVRIHSSNVKTFIAPSEDGSLSITAQTDGWKSIEVDLEVDGYWLDLTVSGGWFGGSVSFGGDNGTVLVSLPDRLYDELTLELGSGKLESRGLAARVNVLDVGSGTFEFEQKAGFSSEILNLHMGSGSVKMTNAATAEYNISMGSGSFVITGLDGQGLIDIGSGKGEVKYTEVVGYNTFDLGSGSLDVYIPEDTRAEVCADIGSGSITVDCCGVRERLSDDSRVSLNGGSGDETMLNCDLGSGKIEFRNASDYGEPDMFGDFPEWSEFYAGIATIDDMTVTGDTLQQATSFSSVTAAF